MEQTKKILKEIGLSRTETEIYLIGLNYDFVSAAELSKQSRIKRTTVYHALNTLEEKGLISKKVLENRVVFSIASPDKIQRLVDKNMASLKEQKDELAKLLPLLNSRRKQKEEVLRISHFDGIEGIKLVVEEALYSRNRQWKIIAPKNNFFSEFDRDYAKYFIETRKARGIMAKSLWENIPPKKVLTADDLKIRNPRFLPDSMKDKFKSLIILFDDKIAIISSVKELSAILIQSKETYETFQAIFDALWEVSREYNKIQK